MIGFDCNEHNDNDDGRVLGNSKDYIRGSIPKLALVIATMTSL